jgi:hypothetical protein
MPRATQYRGIRAPQPPECAPPARSDHQEIIIAAGELYKYERDFAPGHHRFDVYVRWLRRTRRRRRPAAAAMRHLSISSSSLRPA